MIFGIILFFSLSVLPHPPQRFLRSLLPGIRQGRRYTGGGGQILDIIRSHVFQPERRHWKIHTGQFQYIPGNCCAPYKKIRHLYNFSSAHRRYPVRPLFNGIWLVVPDIKYFLAAVFCIGMI